MTTFADMVYHLGGVPVSSINPVMLAGGKWYFCDPTHGTANADGTSPETACSVLKTVYNKCRDGYNDGVIFMGGATAYNPTAAFDWAKTYTHLIGASAGLPGNGQRCRVVGLLATALSPLMTFSGAGCIVANMQFNNEYATGAIGGVLVSGDRCYFENCFFMHPASVTAASYALKLSGDECAFIRCSVGQTQSRVRTLASYGAWLFTSANGAKFINCEFKSWSDLTTHVPVFLDAVTSEGWSVQFEGCLWQNLGNGSCAYGITDTVSGLYHQVIFRGENNLMVKMSAASSALGSTYAPTNGNETASGLLAINVAES